MTTALPPDQIDGVLEEVDGAPVIRFSTPTSRWELTPDGADAGAPGCTLQLTQTVPARETVIEKGFVVGLHHSLERLSAPLAGQPMEWDWDRLAVHQARYHQRGLAPAPSRHPGPSGCGGPPGRAMLCRCWILSSTRPSPSTSGPTAWRWPR
jgi:hypothetical protein